MTEDIRKHATHPKRLGGRHRGMIRNSMRRTRSAGSARSARSLCVFGRGHSPEAPKTHRTLGRGTSSNHEDGAEALHMYIEWRRTQPDSPIMKRGKRMNTNHELASHPLSSADGSRPLSVECELVRLPLAPAAVGTMCNLRTARLECVPGCGRLKLCLDLRIRAPRPPGESCLTR